MARGTWLGRVILAEKVKITLKNRKKMLLLRTEKASDKVSRFTTLPSLGKSGGVVIELKIMAFGGKNIDNFNLGEITPGECTTVSRGMEVSSQSSLGVMEDRGELKHQQKQKLVRCPKFSLGKHSGRG